MGRIKINTDGLQSNIASMDQHIGQLEALNSQLESLINRIDESWEGDACNAYIASMTGRLQSAKQMISVLQEFRSYMQEAVNRFEEKDQQGASRIRGC